jgi:hypothetical protein
MRTYAQWHQFAAAHIARGNGWSAERHDGHLRDMAAWCFAAQEAGETFSLWHASALVGGYACHCAPCCAEREARKN